MKSPAFIGFPACRQTRQASRGTKAAVAKLALLMVIWHNIRETLAVVLLHYCLGTRFVKMNDAVPCCHYVRLGWVLRYMITRAIDKPVFLEKE